jgi:glycosyltransferase involved in cell wall biosynthesis
MNTPAAADALRSSFPRLRNKLILSITNGFDAEDFSQPVRPRVDGKFRIVHSGGMFTATGLQLKQRSFYRILGGAEPGVDILARSPEYLLRAVERWVSRRPEVARDLEIVFAGNMAKEDRDLVQATKAAHFVQFPGFMSHAESLQLIRTADLLFLAMHNLPRGKKCRSIPGKAFEYMAAGRPILAAVPDGDAREFLAACGTGLLSRPDDVESMVLNLDTAYLAWKAGKTPGLLDREYAARFERHALTHELANVFRTVLGEPAVAAEQNALVGVGAKVQAHS